MTDRTVEQLRYHAAKERQYRQRRKAERDAAIAQFGQAAAALLKADFTVGGLVDLILALSQED